MLDEWGRVVFLITVILVLIWFNIPRKNDDEDHTPWV